MSISNYAVEFEGYNDGHPYLRSFYSSENEGWEGLAFWRKENPKVRHRLIKIIEDY